MSAPGIALFVLCALLAVGTALGTVASRRPLRAAMSLLGHIVALAGLFLTLHAQLLAALQLLVYAGAVVVLFVFVIMLIGPDAEAAGSGRNVGVRLFGAALLATVAAGLVAILLGVRAPRPAIAACREPGCAPFGGVEALGRILYGEAALAFELVGVLLTAAIVGAIAVARGRSRAEQEAHEARERERRAEAERRQAEERRLAAEVAAHGGH
ncbi:MAG: NADH-quinone oxidoreductase subunit J [Myxococcota bacterium]|nr:NADH-quinone oxidoreductase subunit J [Myxococcota bacterium]MDW8362554.1 NADH-quinone oxidoreductase subunit J [Myxococcales bacterium]